MSNIYDQLLDISTFIFDVDGVFTNSQLLITEEGALLRSMNVRDGFAVKMALQNGFGVHIITGGSSQGVIKRLQGLGINNIHSGVKDKAPILRNLMTNFNLNPKEVIYMGDDEMDVPCLEAVGLACAPKDADASALTKAQYICKANGGQGCVREVIQMVLEAQSKWIIQG